MIIREIIVGSGKNWYIKDIIDRDDWLRDNLSKNNYNTWYGHSASDSRYVKFIDKVDALAYCLRWNIVNGYYK